MNLDEVDLRKALRFDERKLYIEGWGDSKLLHTIPHNLSFGKNKEHDDGLDTNSDDDDHSNTTQLLR